MDNKSPEAFRTISEVADWLGVPAHVLRFWESRFGQVKPVKRAGGRRYYRPSDMELLGGIRKLLHEDGMTIRGVQKLLRENGVRYVAAMSPPIDGSGDIRDVSPADTPEAQAVTPRRAAPVFDDDIEDAVEAETAPRTEIEAGTETEIEAQTEVEPLAEAGAQDAPPVPASGPDMLAATGETPQEPTPEPAPTEATPPAQEPVRESPETGSEPLPGLQSHADADEAAAAAEDAAARPEPVTVEADTPVFVGAPDMAADGTRPEDGAEGADEAPLEDTLEALEFLSHEAEPASGEGPDAPPDTLSAAPETPGPADAPVETDLAATGPLTPLRPDLAAPDLAARDTTVTDNSPEPEAPEIAAPEIAEQEAPLAADLAPPKAPGPDLVLPDIGPDPEDDAGPQPGPALAAALRRGRSPRHRAAGRGRLNPALIQAYADRLQALSGRLGTTPDGRRPF